MTRQEIALVAALREAESIITDLQSKLAWSVDFDAGLNDRAEDVLGLIEEACRATEEPFTQAQLHEALRKHALQLAEEK